MINSESFRGISTIVFTVCALVTINLHVLAQDDIKRGNPRYVQEYKLKNGLSVYLNEDHNQQLVYGAVVVKGGSKRDPAEATGIAHYLEHMMFKGTDKLGTTNYNEEKIYLDSINFLYDSLGAVHDEEKRAGIQLDINRLSKKASAYIITDDLDNLLSSIGSTDVNAYTTEDCIAYYNLFPGHQISKWLEIYGHRFINPVFRSFQSELEVVYEEKNMYADDFYSTIFESFMEHFYKKHPYGQETVLGRIEHLKNPSLTKMYEYFNTYYVANNMALVLSGNFRSEEIIPIIEEKFGSWRSGEVPLMPDYKGDEISGRELVKKRLYPFRIGLMGFNTVPLGHPDANKISACLLMLSNESLTGLVDHYYLENEISEIEAEENSFVDKGLCLMYYLPKSMFQSFKNCESLILKQLDRLKQGDFSDTLLEAVKTSMIKEHLQYLEVVNEYDPNIGDYYGRYELIIDAFLSNRKWEDVLDFEQKVRKISRDDIMKTAQKYFGNDYLAYQARMGFKKNDKLTKPPYDPIKTSNEHMTSDFAKHLSEITSSVIEPEFIDFNKDVSISDIQDNVHLYVCQNPNNDIFNLTVKYGIGMTEYPTLSTVASYLNICGTDSLSNYEFAAEMQRLGSTFWFSCSSDYFEISLQGFEENLIPSLKMVSSLIRNPDFKEENLHVLVNDIENEVAFEYTSVETLADALLEYALYDDMSEYINRPVGSEVKNLNITELNNLISTMEGYEAFVHYSGKLGVDIIKDLVPKYFTFDEEPTKSLSPRENPRAEYDNSIVYFVNSKNAIQSQIYLYVEGDKNNEKERAVAEAFNLYFDGVVYNEIRDYRSLAYSAQASYDVSFYKENPGFSLAYMSTQADKTTDAIEAMVGIFNRMPEYPDQFNTIKSTLIESISAQNPSFRKKTLWVESMIRQGYSEDPRKERMKMYEEMEFDDILNFYQKNIKNKNLIIIVAGDKNQINIDDLGNFGSLFIVKDKSIIY